MKGRRVEARRLVRFSLISGFHPKYEATPMIPPNIAERIEKIRATVRDELATVAQLDAKVTDLKQILKPAQFQLNDVETFFLGADVLKEARTPAQWDYWLSNAERVLASAVQQREYVASLVARFGADARIMSSR
jgi:hypothetical protein